VSGYVTGILAIYLINVIVAYAVFLPAASGTINLGISGFMAIGAYFSAYFNTRYGISTAITVPTAALISGAIGYVMAFPILRTRGVYLVLATFAFAEIVSGVFVNLDFVGGAAGYPVTDYLGLPAIATSAALVMVAVIYLLNTRFGLTMRAMHDDESVAALFGVNVRWAKIVAFAIGAAIGGLAGALYAHHYNYIDIAYFNAVLSIYVLLYVLIGGTQTPYGPLIGAAVFSLLPEMLRQSVQWRYVIFALIIIAVMAFRPEGILTRPLIDRLFAFRRRA